MRRSSIFHTPQTSKKEIRAGGNSDAIGGMRSPHHSAYRLPLSYHTGKLVNTIPTNTIHDNPQLCHPVLTVLGGGHIPMDFTYSQRVIQRLRDKISIQLGQAPRPPYQGLQHHLFNAWIEASGDPDISLPVWLQTGVPRGLTAPVECHGILPIVQLQQPPHTISDTLTPEGEWSNYSSGSLASTSPTHSTRFLSTTAKSVSQWRRSTANSGCSTVWSS
jgi:hypothetical protein